ncbi:MAG: IPT/TIG domain-containing protein [Blastocatellia bacterium]|nr:IPT/TIG domain-containing protein [Blastocatellia bacterium]
MRFEQALRFRRTGLIIGFIFFFGFGLVICNVGNPFPGAKAAATVQNSVPVAGVSAASFIGSPAPLAPNSIVAGFGTLLAAGTAAATTQPLPTSLLNTSITINGTPAQIFFVSPGQVNFLVPPNLPAGDAQVVITSTATNGDQIISRGQMRIANVAPAIFTANANGAGVPAAVTGRVNGSGQFVFDPAPPYEPNPLQPGQFIPSPIDVGTDQQPAFLILYVTGIRNAPAGSTRAIIGGIEVPVTPVPAPGFTGLEQINLQLPTALRGRGIVELTLVSNGISSNPVSVSIAGGPAGSLAISGFSVNDPAVAGQTVTITGSGFSTTPGQNIVRFGGAQAQRVIAATPNQLTVIVPFGAESSRVAVQTPQGEARSSGTFRINTSISGQVFSTGSATADPAPLAGVTLRVIGRNISVQTNPQGAFVIPNMSPGAEFIEVDGGTTGSSPPFPKMTIKAIIRPDRDNPMAQVLSLQQINGGSGNVGGTASSSATNQMLASISRRMTEAVNRKVDFKLAQPIPQKAVVISDRGVSLEVPIGTTVRFPDGKTSGQVQLTVLQRSRLPGIALPTGIYSPTIAQITPLGTAFSPGASLTFPNPDQAGLGPGAKVDLYRYEFQSGNFIKRGTGTVSADRARVVSDGRVVDVASFWLVAAASNVTTVRGRVIDSFGSPFAGAKVAVNGRWGTSDTNGGFTIGDVPTIGVQQIQAEAVVAQQYGTPPRGLSAFTTVVPGGVTNVGTIGLNDTNQAALILSPFAIDFESNSPPARMEVTLTQPAPAGGLRVTLTSDDTAVAIVPATVTIPAGQTTINFNATRVGAGVALIEAEATLNGGTLSTIAVITVSRPAPTLTGVSPTSAPPGARIVLTGTGLSSTPDNNIVGFARNGNLVAILEPEENESFIDVNGRPALRVTVPSLAAGAFTIAAATIDPETGVISDTSSPLNFTVLASNVPTPALVSVAPGQAAPRDVVTINGANFSTIPSENKIIFRQGFAESEARIVRSTTTQMTVEVPAASINKGNAVIIARRIAGNGAISNTSNALDFVVTADPAEPQRPLLASVVNATTGQPSGREGDLIRVTGVNLGRNFYDPELDELGNDAPLISLLLFTQNNEFAGFSLPIEAQGGTQLTSVVPSGLNAGTTQVTTITVDLDTGQLSNESNSVNFSITTGSLRRVDEEEPNDSIETATEVFLQSIVDGRAARTDTFDLFITFDDGTTEPLPDLFFLSVDKATPLTLTLDFTQAADLDLWLIEEDPDGGYVVVARSFQSSGIVEQISGTLEPGDYHIAIGAYSGSSPYALTLRQGLPASFGAFPPPPQTGRRPVKIERVPRQTIR